MLVEGQKARGKKRSMDENQQTQASFYMYSNLHVSTLMGVN